MGFQLIYGLAKADLNAVPVKGGLGGSKIQSTTTVNAEGIEITPETLVEFSDEWSFKDFTGRPMKDADMHDCIVCGSCFSQEIPDSEVFGEKVQNVTFINCNLDNVLIPDTCRIFGGSQRRFLVQEDGKDWIVDENNQPLELLNSALMIVAPLPVEAIR